MKQSDTLFNSRDINVLISYLNDDIDLQLKEKVLVNLKDAEIKDLYARCLNVSDHLIALELLKQERSRRKS